MTTTTPSSGMRDFFPEDIAKREYVIRKIRETYEKYGFVPLETPAIENLDILLGKYGEEGDQLLYRLLHRRGDLRRALEAESITQDSLADKGLRYDLTIPLARVRAQYELPKFWKRYQIQPVWRGDRPGKGRFREFYQCDVDITGTTSLIAEAEVCSAVCSALSSLGFDNFELRINHRQILRRMLTKAGIDVGRETEALTCIDKLDHIGNDGVREELAKRGFLEQQISALMEELVAPVEGSDELTPLLELLEAAWQPAVRAPSLARGLDYYTGAIFEIVCPDLAGSLGGGGRYDGLIGMFSKQDIPAVGFSLGLERILVVMEERGMFPKDEQPVKAELLLCGIGVTPAQLVETARMLRRHNVRVEIYPEPAKLTKQLEYANAHGYPNVGIVGSREFEQEEITIKRLESGEQRTVPIRNVRRNLA